MSNHRILTEGIFRLLNLKRSSLKNAIFGMSERLYELIRDLATGTDKARCIGALSALSAVTLRWCKCHDFQGVQAGAFLQALSQAIPKFWSDRAFAVEVCKFFSFFFWSPFCKQVTEQVQMVAEAVIENVEDEVFEFYAPVLAEYLSGEWLRREDDVFFRYLAATARNAKKKDLCRFVLRCLASDFANDNSDDLVRQLKRAVNILHEVNEEVNEAVFEFLTSILWHIGQKNTETDWMLALEEFKNGQTLEKLVDFLAAHWTDQNVANFATICETPMLSFLVALVVERHEKLAFKALEVIEKVLDVFDLYFNQDEREPLVKAMGRIGQGVFEKVHDNREAVIAKWFDVTAILLKLVPKEAEENTVMLVGEGIYSNMVDGALVSDHFDYLEKLMEPCEDDSMITEDIMSKILQTVPAETVTNTVNNVEIFKKRVLKTCNTRFGHAWKILVAKMNLRQDVLEELVQGLLYNQENLTLLLSHAESTERIEITLMLALKQFDPQKDDNAMVLAKLFSSAFKFANGLLEAENFSKILEWFNGSDEKVVGTLLLVPEVFECPTSCDQATALLDRVVVTDSAKEAVTRFTYARLIDKAEREHQDINEIDFMKWRNVFKPSFELLLSFLMQCKNNRSLSRMAADLIPAMTAGGGAQAPEVSEHISSLFSIPEEDCFSLLQAIIRSGWKFGPQSKTVFTFCMNHCGNREAWKCALSLLFGQVVDPYADEIEQLAFKGMNLVKELLILTSICLSRSAAHPNLATFCLYIIENLCEGNYISLKQDMSYALCSLLGYLGGAANDAVAPAKLYSRQSKLEFCPAFPYENSPVSLQQESSKTAEEIEFVQFINNQAALMGKENDPTVSRSRLVDVCRIFVTLLLNTYSDTEKGKDAAVLQNLYLLLVENPFFTRQEDKDCAALFMAEEIANRLADAGADDKIKGLAMVMVNFCCDMLIVNSWFCDRYGAILGCLIKISRGCKCTSLPQCVRTAFAASMVRMVGSESDERQELLFAAFLGESDQDLLWLWGGAQYDNLVCILFSTNGIIHNDPSLFDQGSVVMTKILEMMDKPKVFKIDVPKSREDLKKKIAQWRKTSFDPKNKRAESFRGVGAGPHYDAILSDLRSKKEDFPLKPALKEELRARVISDASAFLAEMQSIMANIDLEVQNQVDMLKSSGFYSDGVFAAVRNRQNVFKSAIVPIPQATDELRKTLFMSVYDIPPTTECRPVQVEAHKTWCAPSILFKVDQRCVVAVGFDSAFHPEATDEITPWLKETLPTFSTFESRPVFEIPISNITVNDPKSAYIAIPPLVDELLLKSETPLPISS